MVDEKTANQKFLMKLWLPGIVVALIIVASVLGGVTRGDTSPLVFTLEGVILAVVLHFGIKHFQGRRFAKLLRQDSPGKLSEYFARILRRAPHGRHYAAAQSAVVTALYGDVASADEHLASVDWKGLPPMVRAQETLAQAIIMYSKGEYLPGENLSRLAQSQAEIPKGNPGAKTAELAFLNHINLGMILAGSDTPDSRDVLRTAFEKLPLLGKILAAWGLAVAANRAGDSAGFKRMTDFVAENAPHFRTVLDSIAQN